MDFEDVDINFADCDNDSAEIHLNNGKGYIYLTDRELLELCRMRGLIS